jgi:hypothetical protein
MDLLPKSSPYQRTSPRLTPSEVELLAGVVAILVIQVFDLHAISRWYLWSMEAVFGLVNLRVTHCHIPKLSIYRGDRACHTLQQSVIPSLSLHPPTTLH